MSGSKDYIIDMCNSPFHADIDVQEEATLIPPPKWT